MKKILLFTKLNYRKLEAKLAEMEMSGYRLAAIKGFNCFEFDKSTCKEATYFVVYNYMKKYKTYEIEKQLKRELHANTIEGEFNTPSGNAKIYRMVRADCDLSELSVARDRCLQYAYGQKTIISLMWLLLSFGALKSTIAYGGVFFGLMLPCIVVFFTLTSIRCVYCLIVLIIRNKKR